MGSRPCWTPRRTSRSWHRLKMRTRGCSRYGRPSLTSCSSTPSWAVTAATRSVSDRGKPRPAPACAWRSWCRRRELPTARPKRRPATGSTSHPLPSRATCTTSSKSSPYIPAWRSRATLTEAGPGRPSRPTPRSNSAHPDRRGLDPTLQNEGRAARAARRACRGGLALLERPCVIGRFGRGRARRPRDAGPVRQREGRRPCEGEAHIELLQLRLDGPIDGGRLLRMVRHDQEVGDQRLHDDPPRPQASLPRRRRLRLADERIDLLEPRLGLWRIELIGVNPARVQRAGRGPTVALFPICRHTFLLASLAMHRMLGRISPA